MKFKILVAENLARDFLNLPLIFWAAPLMFSLS